MDFGRQPQKQQKKEPSYKVDWIGTDPNYMFSKTFVDGKEAIELAKKNNESIAYKLDKTSKDSVKWKIIPTDGSKEMVKSVKIKRNLKKKQGIDTFVNADGTGDVEIVTTTELKRNQRVRLLSTVVLSSALGYAGTKMENKYLKYGFFGLAIINAVFTLKNYQFNKDV